MMKRTKIVGALAAISLTGCAAAQPSQELLDARQAMNEADAGHAPEYAPSELKEARDILADAERQKDGSSEEVQFAYLADRAAKQAKSHGNALFFVEQTKENDARYNQLQEDGRIEAERKIEEMQRQLEDVETQMQNKDANLVALGARKSELEAAQQRMANELSASTSALAVSEKARKEADARAAAAIASLSTLANVKEEANRTVVTLSGSVLFKTGESALLPLAEDSLTRVADALMDFSTDRRIVIEGHTDSRGEDSANQKLSLSRAESVMKYLQSRGVEAKRMSAVGRGESRPVASNETAEGRANNRRVELVISK